MHKNLVRVGFIGVALLIGSVASARDSQRASAGASAGPAGCGKIAFARTVYLTNESGSDTTDIWVMNTDGSGQHNLSRSRAKFEGSPDWSPDARTIAFDRLPDIWVMNADGSGQRRLTRGTKGEDWDPTWSPDGRRIAFERNGLNSVIWVMTADGRSAHRLVGGALRGGQDWSPDGRTIVFVRHSGRVDATIEIYTANADDGTGLRRLTNNRTAEYGPRWSPDGRKIAFWRGDGIYVMNADGGTSRRVARGRDVQQPAWSPDGKQLAYVRNLDIWVMNVGGTGKRRLTKRNSRVEYRSPAWAPIP